jgi:glycerophosphoryl diester phosphodiesterase
MPKTARRLLPILGMVFLLIALCAAGAWRGRHRIEGEMVAALDLFCGPQTPAAPVVRVPERLVAHAGGAVNGVAYTNAREALDQHYAAGYRVFELDFDWTSDGRLVVVHDWTSAAAAFGLPAHVLGYDEFIHATRRDGLHQMSFEDLSAWLRAHRDAYVVTDTKASNPRLLTWLAANGGDILPQLIVQIYRLTELDAARRLGPRAVWLTVYRYSYPAWALKRISGVDAMVIPVESYLRYSSVISAAKVPFYVHSVAAAKVDETFRRLPGIYGIYVD